MSSGALWIAGSSLAFNLGLILLGHYIERGYRNPEKQTRLWRQAQIALILTVRRIYKSW